MIRRGIPPPHHIKMDGIEYDTTRGEIPPLSCPLSVLLLVTSKWIVNMAMRGTALLVMPTWEIDMARRDAALLVTPKWKIDVARRDAALLVTPKWKIDVARGAVALLVTSGYRHGKEGQSPPCHAEMGC